MKTFLARWFRRKSQTTRYLRGHCMSLEGLESRIPLTANILVTTEVGGEQVMQEYDPNGTLIDAIVIPPGGTAEKARDLVADTNGDVHVFNGTGSPHLSTFDSDTDTWTHQTMSGWSTFSSSYYGGIGVSDNYVFATDMWGGGSASPKGIVRFDLDDGTSTRFDNRYSYTDLTVGLDGLLYAHYSRTVRVYDPDTLSLQRTINLPFSINGQSQVYRGIAVDASGDIFAASWMEMVHHFDSNGVVQNSTTINGPGSGMFGNLTDIDVSADGRLALGSYWGHVVQMNTDFTDVSYFSTGNKSTFVAFAADGQPTLPSISVGDQAVSEGDIGSTFAQFQVSLSSSSDTAVSVEYQTVGGSATSGTDFSPASGALTFAPGETTKTIAVEIIGDTQDEDDETFQLLLANPLGAVLGDGQGVATIVDDDTLVLPSLSIDNLFVDEGSAGSVNAVFDVTLSSAGSQPVSVNYATTSGSASVGSDFAATSGTLAFATGETTKSITVPIVPDQVDEFSESFYVDLSSPSGATISDGRGIGTIVDDDTASFSIADVTVVEEDSGTTPANFIVSLSTPSSFTVRVDYDTADGTAVAGTDYTATSGTLTFAPGETSKVAAVDVYGDTVDEDNRTFVVNLSNPFFAALGDGQGVGTIQDDDDAAIPSLSIDNLFVDEGNLGTVNAVFDVTLSAASSQPVSVNFTTTNGTALAGSDYTATSGSLTFAVGETVKSITVPVTPDQVDEFSESFYVDLASPNGATIGDGRGIGTIVDDDTASFSISDATVLEGDSGTTPANFIVSLSTPSSFTVRVDYATADGPAIAGMDYTATSGTLTFAPGETSKVIAVDVYGDTVDEDNRSFVVNLSNPFFAALGDGQGVGTIQDDDDAAIPSLNIDSVSINEGDPGDEVYVEFYVSLSAATSQDVSVDFATVDGSAVAGSDYNTYDGRLDFSGGSTTQRIVVPIISDLVDEPSSEEFYVDLSSPFGAVIGVGRGTVTINDDDTASLSIADATVQEGNSGTTDANFLVSLSTPSASTVQVDYDTVNGIALAGTDYTSASGTLTFAPGETSKAVSVPVVGDAEIEPNEDFSVILSNASFASILDGTASGTIQNDDYDIGISIDDVFKMERFPDEFDFTVSLSAPSSQTVTVDYSNTTTLGFAEPGVDYVAESGTITFAPGETSKTLSITVIDDTIDELTEEFFVDLFSPSGAFLADSQGKGFIPDDDTAVLSVADVTLVEGDSGSTTATFDVNFSTSIYRTVTVDYATTDWTATAGSDYSAVAGVLTFEPGETSKSVTVQVYGDDLHERDELIYFEVSSTFNDAYREDVALGIIDDDDMPSFSVSDASVVEGDTGTVQLIFTVSLSNPSEVLTGVQFVTAGGTATVGVDYQSESGTLAFDPFETSKTVAVDIFGDLDAELDETLNLILTQHSGGLMEDNIGEGIIVDND